jgi:hypothetical protein
MAKQSENESMEEYPLDERVQELLRDYGRCTLSHYAKFAAWEAGGVPADENFLDKCREAAAAARTLRLMRTQAERIGFTPLPFGEYLALLCRRAEVPVGPVLRWAGLESPLSIGTAVALGIAKIALNLGIAIRELLVYVHLALVQQTTGLPIGALGGRRGEASGPPSVAAYEASLGALEGSGDDEFRRTVRDTIDAVHRAYLDERADNDS